MRIYTGIPFTEADADKIIELGLGVMVSSEYQGATGKHVNRVLCECPVALDNGAYASYTKGFGFDEYGFLKRLSYLMSRKVKFELIACPDIVAGGMDSYKFSRDWQRRLAGHRNLYLVVQDGMPYTIDLEGFAGIFVGGSTKWKWRSAPTWVYVADHAGIKCHIGRVATAERLKYADEIGADSADSTYFVRGKAWHHVEEYREPRQDKLL